MKHTKHLISIITLAALLSSCSFLDESPYSALTEDEVYGNYSSLLNNAVLSIYQNIGGRTDSEGLQGTGRGVYDLNSLTTDEQLIPTRGGDWYDGGYWQRLHLHQWTADDQTIRDTWNYLYRIVMRTTASIEHITAYNGGDATPEQLEQLVAELRALRAMYYFYLTDLFGGVPIVQSTAQTTAQLNLSSRQDVYAYIINEFRATMPKLSKQSSTNSTSEYYGRMTYYVAAFVMMKLAINQPIYNQAIDADFPVINESGVCNMTNAYDAVEQYADILSTVYALEPNIKNNFSLNNDNSQENIFVIPRELGKPNARYNYEHRSLHYNHASALGIGGENGTSATLQTLDVFQYNTANQDPRFSIYFYYDTVKVNGSVVLAEDGASPLIYHAEAVGIDISGSKYEKTAGARINKYEHDPNGLHDATDGENDIVLFRYADAVLMKAEAIVRQGGDATAEYNSIRSRVGAEPIATQPTLEDIYCERWRELMWEGWHRNDMIRFGKFANDHTNLFPIPTDVLRLHPNWQQNDGY